MNEKEISVLKEKIDKAEIISFDVFDTLLYRKVSDPIDVFEILEKKFDIPGFKQNRINFQTLAAQKVEKLYQYPHANLDEIYDVFKEKFPCYDWDVVKGHELEIEYDCIFQNVEMYDIYLYALNLKKKIIATTDMYLSSIDINNLLRACGFNQISHIYDSAECRRAKFNGELFFYIAKDLFEDPSIILHIGDNKKSDFDLALKAGWNAFHYKTDQVIKKSNSLVNSFHESLCRDSYISKRCQNDWEIIGYKVGGPLYLGLMKWVKHAALREGVDKVYFLARDGYILNELFKETNDFQSIYFYASRRSLLLAGITKLDEEALALLPPFVTGQSVKNILDYLCISGFTDDDAKKVGLLDGLETIISSKEMFHNVKELYLLHEQHVLQRCEVEKLNIKKYLESIQFFDGKSLIFDCGWNGSSQHLLDRAIKAIGYNEFNSFLYAGIMDSEKSRRQLKNKKYFAYLFNIETNQEIREYAKKNPLLFELFFCAPHASVLYYDELGLPVFENIENSHDYKDDICQGIKKYIQDTLFIFEKYNIQSDVKDATFNLINLINEPSAKSAIMIGDLMNIDGFASFGNTKKYIAKVKLRDVAFKSYLDLYWPEGIMARTDISMLTKYFVSKYYNLNTKTNIRKCDVVKHVEHSECLYDTYLNLKNRTKKANAMTPYELWINRHEVIEQYVSQAYEPLISIIIPVYNVLENQLLECIQSVLNQTYMNWELCMVDDCSTWESVRKVLKKYENNSKIKIKYRTQNGHIATCTNDCIALASGEYIAFLDCDDILSTNALAEMVYKLNVHQDYDFIYSDEDKLTANGDKRHSPFFKPDWSPDTFMSLMYTCHFSIYRRSIVIELGGIRQGFDGAQDYDFTLRFVEKARKIGHIRKILYHWRERKESIANNPEAKPYALKAMEEAKIQALRRRDMRGTISYVSDMYQYRIVYEPNDTALVSIIIPSKDNIDILKRCIESIILQTNNIKYEIIVVDNGSSKSNRTEYEHYLESMNIKYIYMNFAFNFSRMCNIGASNANGNLLLFLNDDTEVLSANWLYAMAGHASLPYIGAVGAKLLYPNSSIIQHVGIANMPIGPSHSLMHCDDQQIYYYGRNRLEYNCLAVTAACLMVEKVKFEKIGRFDESFPIAYNDVVLNFALAKNGYYNVIRNDAVLYHYESISRGSDDADETKQKRLVAERKKMYERYPEYDGFDPFYNTNMSAYKVDFSLDYITCSKSFSVVIDEFAKYEHQFSNQILQHIDEISLVEDKYIYIRGWAFHPKWKFNDFNEVSLIVANCKGKALVLNPRKMKRFDVAKNFKANKNIIYSGFECYLEKSKLIEGNHRIAIQLRNINRLKKSTIYTNRGFDK